MQSVVAQTGPENELDHAIQDHDQGRLSEADGVSGTVWLQPAALGYEQYLAQDRNRKVQTRTKESRYVGPFPFDTFRLSFADRRRTATTLRRRGIASYLGGVFHSLRIAFLTLAERYVRWTFPDVA